MARYWQAKTFHGFFVEGTHQDRTIAGKLLEELGGVKMSDEIMGAGFYLWMKKGADPALRIKDLADRTIIEVLLPDLPVKEKAARGDEIDEAAVAEEPAPVPPAPPVEEAEEEQEEAEEEKEEEPLPAPDPESQLGTMLSRLDTLLGTSYERVSSTPVEHMTTVDLKLTKWQTPKPMAITEGEPIGGIEKIDLEMTVGRRGGGVGGLLTIVVGVGILAVGTWYVLTSSASEPYYVYQPGRQFERTEEAVGFIQPETDELIIIQVPTRLDTLWGSSPRFIRAEEDTITANVFIAEDMDELRVDQIFGPVVILTPARELEPSTANELAVDALQWNQSEDWEEWFAMEINRALIRGTLVRIDDELYLQSGQNYIGLTLSPYLSDPAQIMLRFAELREKEVLLEVQFRETYRYGQERTSARRRLFQAEVNRVTIF